MKKILLVFGTRPEAIKMAPLVKKLQEYPEQFIESERHSETTQTIA